MEDQLIKMKSYEPDHDVIARAISQWDDEKNLSGLSKP
jgi:hypothetical protein